MKKSILLLASALVVISCNIPEGGNKGRLKMTDDVVRYDDQNAPRGTYAAPVVNSEEASVVVSDSAVVETPVGVEGLATEQ